MENKENDWQIDLAMNIAIILCFVLNFSLTLSIIIAIGITAMVGCTLFSKEDFKSGLMNEGFEEFANMMAQRIVMLIATFLLATISIYNILSKI